MQLAGTDSHRKEGAMGFLDEKKLRNVDDLLLELETIVTQHVTYLTHFSVVEACSPLYDLTSQYLIPCNRLFNLPISL